MTVPDWAPWILAAPLLFLGLWTLLFNTLRYTPLVGSREPGARLPSSVPLAGSLFVVFGLALAPIEVRWWYYSVLLLEVFSVDISLATDEEDAA